MFHPPRLPYSRGMSFCASAVAVFAFCLILFSPYVHAQSVPGHQAPEKPQQKQENLQVKAARGEAPLRNLYDYLKVESTKLKRLPALDAREKQKKLPGKALRIGAVRSLPQPLDPSSDGTLYQVAEGDVRVMGVVTEGALYTRVQFAKMALPAGARVFVYSMQNPDEFYGPYEGHGPSEDGTFWTPPMKGDGVVIEYFITKGATSHRGAAFKISNVAHVFRDPVTLKVGGCHNDVTAEWTNVAKSVGRLDFVSGASSFLCTGTLLNDTIISQTPYLLTANHCFSSQTEAQSLRVYWNYNTGNSPPPGTPFTDGANLLATGTSSDFTFVRLTGTVPGGLFFSGWEASNFAGSAPASGIHHPDGSYKRISFGTGRQPTSPAECGGGLQCLAVDWNLGVTEGGSSGSGIWTGNPSDAGGPRLIGTLTGGPSACGASPANLKDFYGRFSVTYPNISAFLTGTNCVTSLNPTNQSFSASGGTGSFSVNAPGGCAWTANTTDGFVTVTSGMSGSGNGTVNFSVANNGGAQRSGSINVGGQVFNISQSGGGACATTPISLGQSINGTLATSDCPLGDGSFYDGYTFSGTAGQQISISMTASFDTYLFLRNPDGSTLAQDDDGGAGTDSRIPPESGSLTLPTTATYTIVANSFAPGVTGPYTLTLNGTAPPTPLVQFSQGSYSVNESQLFATINVTRTGDTSGAATVKYATSDATDVNFRCDPSTSGQTTGAASRKCDYHIASGRLRFAAGEVSKQIILSVVNDVYVEGPETLTIALSNPTGPTLGTPSTATVTINSDDAPGAPNPIDGTTFYVRQLYVDLLSREPDTAGWNGWISRIDLCGQPGQAPPPCDRVTVGGDGFLRSGEFFDRQFFVLRLYRTGLGRILLYPEVGDLAYVSGFLSALDLESNKQDLVAEIMSRPEFGNQYNGLTNAAFVDALQQKAGVTVPQGVRDDWVTALNGSTKTRAQVYREISERQEVSDRYLHEAQVVSAYYGFFTRNPDGAYLNFLSRLDSGEINLGDLANAFINAAEYGQRFGP